MKLIPGADCGVAAYLLERSDALIIESFGVGGLPTYKAGDYYETVKTGLEAGKTVVMTTQDNPPIPDHPQKGVVDAGEGLKAFAVRFSRPGAHDNLAVEHQRHPRQVRHGYRQRIPKVLFAVGRPAITTRP